MKRSIRMKDRHMWIVFISPGLLLLFAVLGYPAVISLLYSFQPEQGGAQGLTLSHYAGLLKDPFFSEVCWNTVQFVGLTVVGHMALGLAVALALDTMVPARPLFRLIALLP